ncbi:MAG: hypothetical protein AABX00_05545 [Nanoarchaeota archaeon]|mgnify:FL=1
MNKPPLYDIVDKLYHGVMDKMPQALQDRGEAMAFLLGAGGIYGVVKGLQWTSRNAMNKLIPNFDEKWLPALEKICIAGMASAPIIYAMADPDGARDIMTQHPTYTSGMAGVYVGSIVGAVQDLVKRSKQKLYKK